MDNKEALALTLLTTAMFAFGILVGVHVGISLERKPERTFFGAVVDGPIIPQFGGKMECAWVSHGDIRKCMCHINAHGWGWNHDKTFMTVQNPQMCEKEIK